MFHTIKLLCVLLALLFASSTIAQSVVSIDSSFNGIGYNTLNLTGDYTVQTGDNIQLNPADKKYVVRAFVNPLGAYIKYNRDGKLDTTFNHTGILIQAGSERYTRNFFIDSLRRLINGLNEPVLVSRTGFMRTLPNGTPDTVLDHNGIHYVPGPLNVEGVWTAGPHNSFFACGHFVYGSQSLYGLAITKFKSDYSVDSSFGQNGITQLHLGTGETFFNELQFTRDDKIVIPYFYRTAPFPDQDYNTGIIQLLPNGHPDTSFGVTGISQSPEVTPAIQAFWGCRVLRNNHILAFGWYESSSVGRHGFVESFLPNGKPDSSFGVFGCLYVPQLNIIYAAQEQRDGKLLLSGEEGYTLVRVTADGLYDPEFGSGGVFRSVFSPDVGFAYNLFLENDTTVLITGNAFDYNESNNVTTARYRLQWQPLVTGVHSHYCLGGTITGHIINFPASDTTVTAFVDGVSLTIGAAGTLSFPAGSVGPHHLSVIFTKDTLSWNESIHFTTDTVALAHIQDTDQTICDYTPLQIRATVPVYWRSAVYSNATPTSSFVFNGTKRNGPVPVIAVRDNGGCGLSRDTIILNVVNLQPAITMFTDTLQTPLTMGASYQWYRNNDIIPNAIQHTYTAPHNGSYTVRESLSNCARTSEPYVATSIDPLEIPDMRGLAARYCSNADYQSVKLANPPDTPATITLVQDGFTGLTYSARDSAFSFSPGTPGTHTISVIYSRAGLTLHRDSSYTVDSALPAGLKPAQNSNVLTAPVMADSYQWLLNGVAISGATLKSYQFAQSGVYSYVYKVSGCTSPESIGLSVIVSGIIDASANREIVIFPNPVTTDLYIEQLNPGSEYQVVIYSSQGGIFKQTYVLHRRTKTISLRDFSAGLYVISLYNAQTGAWIGSNKIIVTK